MSRVREKDRMIERRCVKRIGEDGEWKGWSRGMGGGGNPWPCLSIVVGVSVGPTPLLSPVGDRNWDNLGLISGFKYGPPQTWVFSQLSLSLSLKFLPLVLSYALKLFRPKGEKIGETTQSKEDEALGFFWELRCVAWCRDVAYFVAHGIHVVVDSIDKCFCWI